MNMTNCTAGSENANPPALRRSGADRKVFSYRKTVSVRPFPRLTFIGACLAAAALSLGFPAPADAAEGATVTLTWTPPADVSGIDYYQYRVSDDNGATWNPDWTKVPGSNENTNRYVVTGLTFGTLYTFQLRSANEFFVSAEIETTARALWAAPPNLAATPGDSQVALQWDRNPEINHYAVQIQGGATPVTQFVQSGSGSKTTAAITGLTNGTKYTFMVQGVSGAVSGSDIISASSTVTATPGLSSRFRRLNAEILSKHALTVADVTNRAIGARMADPCVAKSAAYKLAGGSTLLDTLRSNALAIKNGTLTVDNVLAGSSFLLPLATVDNDRTGGAGWPVVWGRGDRHRLESTNSALAWDGAVLTGQLGIDGCPRKDLMTGLTLSRSVGAFDYTDGTGQAPVSGDYESRMTSVHPYLGWTSPQGLGLWATVGYGWGKIEIDDEQAGRQMSGTTLKTAALGVRGPLISDGSLIAGGTTKLMLKGEASWSQVKVKGNDELIEKQTVNANRLRLALEGSHEQVLASGRSLTPSLELGLRRDWGDGITGNGIEIGSSLRYRDPAMGLTVEGNGRVLAGQSDYREWSLGGSVRLDPDGGGRGLSFSLVPTWGETASGVERMWDHDVAELATDDRAANDNVPQMRLDSELGYGFGALGGHVLLTPYGGFSLAGEGSQRYRIGGRFKIGSSLNLSLEGERRVLADDAAAEHGAMLRMEASW